LNTRTLIALTTALLASITLSSCSTEVPDDASPAAEFGHTHGLGYDSKTGTVFAATHTGVWELPTDRLPTSFGTGSLITPADGEPARIANRQQDTMGFLVVDDGRLLGSGHPDPADTTAPANLGLVSSDNAGRDWVTVSLGGESDFHDLAATPTAAGALRIFGYDATTSTILISDDSGTTWSPGASLELRDMAADPSNPDRIYVTTAVGLQLSVDAARTFTPVADAPALVLVDATDNGYVGIDTAGTLWSTDGSSWIQGAAIVGDPQALAYVGGSEPWVLVADARGITATADLGVSTVPLVDMAE
jgi:hypothetical protein